MQRLMGANRSRRGFLALAGGAVGAAALASCGSGSSSGGGAGGSTGLTFWNGNFAAYGKGTDTSREAGDYWLAKAVDAYQAENDVTVDVISTVEGSDLLTKLRTSGVAGDGPDLATIWSGTYLLSLKDFLAPLDEYYPAGARQDIAGWEAVSDGLVDGNTLYGVPCGTDGLTVMYYNMSVLDKAGVAVDSSSVQEWDDFIDMLDKIKSTGVTPLGLCDSSYLYYTLLYWIAQNTGGTAGIVSLSDGSRDFSSPEVKDVVERWLGLGAYTLPGAPVLTSDDNVTSLLNGEVGVIGSGGLTDLREGLGEELMMTKMPNITTTATVRDSGIGGPGQCFAIPASSEHVQETVDFINFLNSLDQQVARAELEEGPQPNVAGIETVDIYEDPFQQQLMEWSATDFIFWPDNTLPADLVSHIVAQTQLVWNGDLTVDQYLESLDSTRDSIADAG